MSNVGPSINKSKSSALAGAGKFIDASGSLVSKWAYAKRVKK